MQTPITLKALKLKEFFFRVTRSAIWATAFMNDHEAAFVPFQNSINPPIAIAQDGHPPSPITITIPFITGAQLEFLKSFVVESKACSFG